MSDAETPEEEPAPKKSKKGLLIALVLAAALGGGAFYAVFSGMVLAPKEEIAKQEGPVLEDTKKATFVPLDPIVVSLGRGSSYQLKFNAQLEVEPSKKEDVANLMPRILDVLNGYLRAVEVSELQEPSALIRLRVQMLRRIELVTGEGHVKDLLITEFVFT